MDNRDADEADAADPDAAAPRANGATPELDVVEPVMTFSQQNSRQQPNQAASAEESQQAATAARAGNGAGPRSAEQTWDDWGTWNGSSVASSQPQGSGGGGARSASRATDGAGVNGAEAASAGDDDDFWQDEDGDPPDITTLTQDERDKVLRLTPFDGQVQYFQADSAESVQRWAIAAVVTLLSLTKAVVIAAGAVSSPLWWPWLQAWRKNQSLLSQYRYVGLWRAKVLQVRVQGRRLPVFKEPARGPRPPPQAFKPYLQLLIGDYGSGARSELSVPFSQQYERIREGDAVELLVVATRPGFTDFKALQEAYFPEEQLWLANYPYVDRDAFLELSFQIEAERAAAAADAVSPMAQPLGASPYL